MNNNLTEKRFYSLLLPFLLSLISPFVAGVIMAEDHLLAAFIMLPLFVVFCCIAPFFAVAALTLIKCN